MKPSFDLKLFTFLFLAFIGMTVIGTLSHELGHYSVAKCLGYEATINYQSSRFWSDSTDIYFTEIYGKYSEEIRHNQDFPGREQYRIIRDQYTRDSFKITLGGPLQTMLTGTLGLILLLVYRKKHIHSDSVSLTGWVFIFMTLLWLRQVANLFMVTLSLVLNGRPSMSGDEMHLTWYLNLPQWSIQIPTGIIGLGVLAYIVFKILPPNIRFTFLLAGLLGGVSGYYLWLIKFGRIIMP